MKKISKIQQDSTLSVVEVISSKTGLTPIQERAVFLLVSGKNVTDVSTELSIDRGTLYNWLDKLTVRAYYQRLCKEIKDNVQNGLLGLYNDAIEAIGGSLKSDNEAIKLKAAFWLIERLDILKTNEADPRETIKKDCIGSTLDWDMSTFDEGKYKQLCKQNGLLP